MVQIDDYSGLRKPNRVILTAAAANQTSFGCSAEIRRGVGATLSAELRHALPVVIDHVTFL
jgi:hypothetical protein